MSTMATCTNCGRKVEPDDGGAIWYHADTMALYCDGDDEVDHGGLDPQADPAMKRIVVTTTARAWTTETWEITVPDDYEPTEADLLEMLERPETVFVGEDVSDETDREVKDWTVI